MKNHICTLWNPNIRFNNNNNNNNNNVNLINTHLFLLLPDCPGYYLFYFLSRLPLAHLNTTIIVAPPSVFIFFIYGLDHPTSLVYSENKSTNTNIPSSQPLKDKHIENRIVTVAYFLP